MELNLNGVDPYAVKNVIDAAYLGISIVIFGLLIRVSSGKTPEWYINIYTFTYFAINYTSNTQLTIHHMTVLNIKIMCPAQHHTQHFFMKYVYNCLAKVGVIP
jgi:hypothetical protein